jgi:LacI family transcriptional regulator
LDPHPRISRKFGCQQTIFRRNPPPGLRMLHHLGLLSQCMGVRLKDVAKALGLSISTVSAALHNRADINEATRDRVLRKASDLNYHPNRLAHGLATQKTHVLGVVVPNLSRPFFPHVLEGIDAITYPAGYTLVVFNTDDDPAREEKGISALISSQVDGLIIASALPPRNNGVWKPMDKSGVPFVLMDRFFASVPFVGADDDRIGFMVTQHMIQQGYRRIAHLAATSVVTGFGRYRGYVRALREAGIRVRRDYIVEVTWREMDGGLEGTTQLLRLRPRPDAIFAVNDLVAIGAMKTIQQAGLHIPEDCGLIGVGNVRYGDCLSVPLSTVDLHPREVGTTAATMLLSRIHGQQLAAQPVFLEPRLIVRDSSRRIQRTGRAAPTTEICEARSSVTGNWATRGD